MGVRYAGRLHVILQLVRLNGYNAYVWRACAWTTCPAGCPALHCSRVFPIKEVGRLGFLESNSRLGPRICSFISADPCLQVDNQPSTKPRSACKVSSDTVPTHQSGCLGIVREKVVPWARRVTKVKGKVTVDCLTVTQGHFKVYDGLCSWRKLQDGRRDTSGPPHYTMHFPICGAEKAPEAWTVSRGGSLMHKVHLM